MADIDVVLPSWIQPQEEGILGFAFDVRAVPDVDSRPNPFVNWLENQGIPVDDIKALGGRVSSIGHKVQCQVNDLLGVARAVRRLSEIWHTFGNLVNQAFNGTRIGAILATPGDLVEMTDEIQAAIADPTITGKGIHSAGALAAAGNIGNNFWTFMLGLDTLVHVSKPFMQFTEVLGPVGWGMSALYTLPMAYQWYKIDQTLEAININQPVHAQINGRENMEKRIRMFELFTLDQKGMADGNSYQIQENELLAKLHIVSNIPLIERPYEIQQKVNALALNYFKIHDRRITQDFIGSVRKNYTIVRLHYAFKIAAVATGLVALMFFYVPGMNHFGFSNHLGWSFLILTGAIGFTVVVSDKINSRIFAKELEEQVQRSISYFPRQ